jgi:hypothetical protein
MKKIILTFLAFGLLINSFAQDEYKKRSAVGIHFLFFDFKTAAELKNDGLANVINEGNWSDTKRMNPGFALSYMQGVNDKLDFVATASSSFLSYPVPNKPVSSSSQYMLDVTAMGNLKLVSDKYWVSPYLSLGAGFSKYGAIMVLLFQPERVSRLIFLMKPSYC